VQIYRRGIATSVALVVAAIILVAGAACVLVLSVSNQTTTQTTATSSSMDLTSASANQATSTSIASQDGLQLGLSVNGNVFSAGQNISVTVSEFNVLGQTNNVSSSGDWFVPVALGSCTNLNYLPIGVALFAGHYDADNVSSGTRVQIFPVTVCPMIVRYISGYEFQADSDLATILPGSAPTAITASVDVVNGTSTGAGIGQTSALNPGQYTIVAADEWGAVAFLYFQVQGLSLAQTG
jgi:hypothetical protein